MSIDRGESFEPNLTPIDSQDDGRFGDDIKGLYVRDTKRHSGLEREEVARLSALVQQGITAGTQLENAEELSSDDAELLQLSVDEGRKARNEIVVANTGLVFRWASHYEGRGVDFLDLVQAGNLGLMRAAEKFDPSKGFAFSTYATRWIQAFVSDELHQNGRTIRVPNYQSAQMQKLRRIKLEHQVLTGEDMTVEQMAKAMEYEDIEKGRGQGKAVDKIKDLLGMSKDMISLNIEVGKDQGKAGSHGGDAGELYQFLPPSPDEIGLEEEAAEWVDRMAEVRWVRKLLANSTVDEKAKQIVRMEFGIGYDKPMSRNEIKKALGGRDKTITTLFNQAMEQLKREAELELAGPTRN